MSKSELNDSFDKEFDYYEKRCEELKILHDKSESQTSKMLFQEALDITETNIQLFRTLLSLAVKFHSEFNKVTKDNLSKFDKEINKTKNEILEIKSSNISKNEKSNLMLLYEQKVNRLGEEIRIKGAMHDLELEMRFKCFDSLRDLLFNHILKINSVNFKYDIILDLFKKLIQKMLVGSEEVETLISLSIKERKYQSLASADRINNYIEKYIEVSKLWHYYANFYLTTL